MSAERKGGLGRGLAALIPTGPTDSAKDGAAAAKSKRDADWLSANGAVQAKAGVAGGDVAGAVSREVPVEWGTPHLRQPRQLPDDKFELVMGERRLRAAQRAGLEKIPAIVRQTSDDAMLRDALLENIHRVQLNPLEEAAAYQQLLEEFNVTHDELANRLGR